MKILFRGALPLLAVSLLCATLSCGPANDPEVVALAYVRASKGGDPDTAVRLLDIEQIASRVEEELVVLDSSGRETFLEDSIETLLWGLFRETLVVDYLYDATPAELDGDTASVSVTLTSVEATSDTLVVHLRHTAEGWRVSGDSLDPLVAYVIQRLQEKY
jgi:hypothetical protein